MGTTADKLNKVLQTKEAIRTSINNKGGTLTETDKFSDYATAIDNIQSGSANEPITITQNGTYTAPEGVGYSPINVNVPSKEEETKSITITENGTTTVMPTSGKLLSKVDIVANVPQTSTDILLKDFLAVRNAYQLFYELSSLTYEQLNSVIKEKDTSSCTNMNSMFNGCRNLTTIPLIDTSSCISMNNMFEHCSRLTTIPLINTSSCISMNNMFNNCSDLTNLPQFDTSSCTEMSYMFYRCTHLTTIPQFDTSSCISMNNMFEHCSRLTTIPLINTSSCINMSAMFNNCSNLTNLPQFDTSSCTKMQYMFQVCSNLITIDLSHMKIMSTNASAYFAYNCYSLTKLIIRNMDAIPALSSNSFENCYHFYGTTNSTYNPEGLKDGRIYVPDDKVEALKTATNWSVFADIIKPLSFENGEHISNIVINNAKLSSTTPRHAGIYLNEFTNIPTVDITVSNESIARINNINITTEKITFDINALGVEGNATITINISGDYNKTLTTEVSYTTPMQYTVEKVDGATYGFELNSNEYYESTNKGKASSYSLCKLVFNATEKNNTLKLECINSGENTYDFGILSNIDTTLTLSSSTDSSNVYKSFDSQSSTTPVVITYPEASVGEHFIYIKYKKDSGGDNGNDSLQFKVIS